MPLKIIFATNNAHKLKEIQHLIGEDFSLQSLKDIGFEGDIPENKPTIEGNAIDKATFIYNRFKQPCFADDTGLEVSALNGEPGVYSARYAGPLENFGTEDIRSKANIEKLLTNLHNTSDRSARFRTVIAYIDGHDQYLFEGIVNGHIIVENRGEGGFGYDPIFIPDGYNQTFAQMPLSEKNKISHRAWAFSKFVDFIKQSRK